MTRTPTGSRRIPVRHIPSPSRHPTTGVNVGETERLVSMIGGGALAMFGLTRGSLGGLALAAVGGSLLYRGMSGHCHLYGALGIDTSKPHGPSTSVAAGQGVKVEKSLTINRSPEELFRFWRNLENLPRVMRHLQSVKVTGGNRSHWVACGPFGAPIEWDAEIINEKSNELIAWRSLEGSNVDTAGSVHFTRAAGGTGTEVRVVLKYDPPAGKIGAALAKLFGSAPEQEIEEDLKRFKQAMESGELATSQTRATGQSSQPGQASGSRSNRQSNTGSRDLVGEASEDSFPASDPPSWTTGR